jgi:16S rRNA (cytosine967-C5)-methyltransferase
MLTRLHVDQLVDITVGDATEALHDDLAADRALVDAPCSGLGVLGRRPDIRWRRTESDAVDMAATQRALIEAAVASVRVGGAIAYSTCTLDRIECEDVVDAVLAALPVERAPIPAELAAVLPDGVASTERMGEFRTWPQLHGTDGFFCALLTKVAPSEDETAP